MKKVIFPILTICILSACTIFTSCRKDEINLTNPNQLVVNPDPSVVDELHEVLVNTTGSLNDLLQLKSADEGDLPALPDGLSVVDVDNIPLEYPKSHVTSSDIIANIDHIDPSLQNHYDRYVMFVPENKQPFFLIIQKGVEDKRAIRAKEIVEFLLRDVAGSEYGADKSEVANKMGSNGAVLLMLTGIDGDGKNLSEKFLPGQELYEIQTPIYGEDVYLSGDEWHRDAGYEEIFHFVHDYGIGANSEGALEEYQEEILALTAEQLSNNIIKESEIEPHELAEEAAGEAGVSNEYIATVLDAYYGLWDAVLGWPDTWGGYEPRNREQVTNQDPEGLKLVEKFIPPYLNQVFSMDPTFTGTFKMNLTPGELYTNRSRYLRWLRLTGENDVSVEGNEQDNIFINGPGNNEIYGGDGNDIVVYEGKYEDYSIERSTIGLTVNGRGVDLLINIEYIAFADLIMSID